MRFGRLLAGLVLLPIVVSGCSSLGGSSTAVPSAGASGAGGGSGQPWIRVAPGNAVPSAGASSYGSYPPALPPVSFLPTSGAQCTTTFPEEAGQVMIPLVVTPGAKSLKVTWPNRYGNTYRLTAVPQSLVVGAQPEPGWQTVNTGGDCEATATITGLQSGKAYIVWLDAPNTPREVDGTRSLYTGRSPIVKPN